MCLPLSPAAEYFVVNFTCERQIHQVHAAHRCNCRSPESVCGRFWVPEILRKVYGIIVVGYGMTLEVVGCKRGRYRTLSACFSVWAGVRFWWIWSRILVCGRLWLPEILRKVYGIIVVGYGMILELAGCKRGR